MSLGIHSLMIRLLSSNLAPDLLAHRQWRLLHYVNLLRISFLLFVLLLLLLPFLFLFLLLLLLPPLTRNFLLLFQCCPL